jgi:DNA helicase-2/ATP-dependent DNA helicase PcrA
MYSDTDSSALNPAQRAAVEHGIETVSRGESPAPLLIIAGAGSGKTTTLAHRVAALIDAGADPHRILMLTFTRRAAAEMTRRAECILAARRRADAPTTATTTATPTSPQSRPRARIEWAGTFHAIANRLLRHHASSVGLDPAFTVLDRSDAADLMDLLRNELGLSKKQTRFPKKATCLAIYSHTVNAQRPLAKALETAFPWCEDWADDLKRLFAAYTEAKQSQNVLDYDDLLLYWYHLMAEPELAGTVGDRFDHVLVDEYQDTNVLQAHIIEGLKPDGAGVTVVGDDAQSIYSFRAATVRNILDFPRRYDPPADIVTLEQNYRSTSTILHACNGVIALAPERFTKDLFSTRSSGQRPVLATVDDETCQVDYVVERILDAREAGVALTRQAVLFRASHHSDALEVELTRRDIPFVKFGGLKFLEAAHVKDVLSVLRWAENPRDVVAAFRILQILPGIGPAAARAAVDHLESNAGELRTLRSFRPPAAALTEWPGLCRVLERLAAPATGGTDDGSGNGSRAAQTSTAWHGQVGLVRAWYEPHLERLYDNANIRAGDVEQLEQIAATYPSRERFLTELTLDPPDASGDEAGPPHLDEDYLILSTIHSAKGQEWDSVYVLNVADGCIPSDMATGKPDQIEEERRLLYVAMTRARDDLHLVHPLRFFKRQQHRHGDSHVFTPRSRFLDDSILDRFERRAYGRMSEMSNGGAPTRAGSSTVRVDVGARLRAMWD